MRRARQEEPVTKRSDDMVRVTGGGGGSPLQLDTLPLPLAFPLTAPLSASCAGDGGVEDSTGWAAAILVVT